jgi:hypothetical protein
MRAREGEEIMYEHGLITPVVALVIWSLVIWLWLYLTRIPAMQQKGVKAEEGAFARELNTKMPAYARQVADNYNHLMEQPTIFYAICFSLQLLVQTHAINIGLAWTYVTLRVVHSLVQCTFNNVPLRFLVFVLSTLVLAALTVHAAIGVGLVPFNLLHGQQPT